MATYFIEVVTDAPDVDEGLSYVTAQENVRRAERNEPPLNNSDFLVRMYDIALNGYKNEYLNNRVAPVAAKYKAADEAVRLEAEDAVKDVVLPGELDIPADPDEGLGGGGGGGKS